MAHERPFSQINLTPLVGVLIALFAGVTVLTGSRPEAEAPALAMGPAMPPPGSWKPRPAPLMVVLRSDGRLFIDEKLVAQKDLAAELRRGANGDRDPGVWVRADADIPYGRVFDLHQDIEAAGFDGQVRIINENVD